MNLSKESVNASISHIDILRIRAVCTSWRSSIPLDFKISKSLSPIELPIPKHMIYGYHEKSQFYLIESNVYLFQPCHSHSPHTGWSVKVVKTVDGKLRILNPLSNKVIRGFPDKKLNLLDFHVSHVCKSYHVQWVLKFHVSACRLGRFLRKILLIWSDQTNHFSLMAIGIMHDHLLCFQSGDENWTRPKDGRRKIVDIIVYKGNFYAVDRYGETIMYDPSSFNETNVSSTIKISSSSLFNKWSSKKRLAESGAELFLVDMFLDTDVKRELRRSGPSWNNPMEIIVYRLDEEQHEWIVVHTLADRIFFAGDDCCFSISSLDFGDQCRGNCIYYENGSIIVDILRKLLPEYHDDDSEGDSLGDLNYGFSDYDDDYYGPIPVDGGVKLSSNDAKIDKNDLGSKSSGCLS